MFRIAPGLCSGSVHGQVGLLGPVRKGPLGPYHQGECFGAWKLGRSPNTWAGSRFHASRRWILEEYRNVKSQDWLVWDWQKTCSLQLTWGTGFFLRSEFLGGLFIINFYPNYIWAFFHMLFQLTWDNYRSRLLMFFKGLNHPGMIIMTWGPKHWGYPIGKSPKQMICLWR